MKKASRPGITAKEEGDKEREKSKGVRAERQKGGNEDGRTGKRDGWAEGRKNVCKNVRKR